MFRFLCPSFRSDAIDKTLTKNKLGKEKVCFLLCLEVAGSLREAGAGTEADIKEECRLLACPP